MNCKSLFPDDCSLCQVDVKLTRRGTTTLVMRNFMLGERTCWEDLSMLCPVLTNPKCPCPAFSAGQTDSSCPQEGAAEPGISGGCAWREGSEPVPRGFRGNESQWRGLHAPCCRFPASGSIFRLRLRSTVQQGGGLIFKTRVSQTARPSPLLLLVPSLDVSFPLFLPKE